MISVSSCGVKLQEVLSGLEKERLKHWRYMCTFVAFLNITILFFFFLSTWGVKSLRLLVGLTAKLCIFPPACLSRGACSCRESTRVVGPFRKGVGSGARTFIMPAISTMAQVWRAIQLCFVVLCHANSVADSGRVRGVQIHPPLAASNVFLRT